MKVFKLTDLLLQSLLTVFSVVYCLAAPERFIFLYGYFLVGGWQVISSLVHLFQKGGWVPHFGRVHYQAMLKWVLFTGLFSYLLMLIEFPLIMLYLYVMLVIGPVMAVWYYIICITEWNTLKKKELIHLK